MKNFRPIPFIINIVTFVSLLGLSACNVNPTISPPPATTTLTIAPGPPGTLEGTVNIGLETERSDIILPYQPESYRPRKVMVYARDSGETITQIDIDQNGKYKTELPAGTYTIDINRFENDNGNKTPLTITIQPGQTYTVDIIITTDATISPPDSVNPPEGSNLVKRNLDYSGRPIWRDTLVAIESVSQYLYAYDFKTSEKTVILQMADNRSASEAAIYDNKIVWQSGARSELLSGIFSSDSRKIPNYDIFLYDMENEETRQLTDNLRPQISPNIYEDTVVWLDARNAPENPAPMTNPVYDIYAYNVNTGVETRITAYTTAERCNQVSISGKYIVWSDSRHEEPFGTPAPRESAEEYFSRHPFNSEIYLYNLETGEERRITDNARPDRAPVVDGSRIIWERDEAFQRFNIYMYDLETGLETQVTHSGFVWYSYAISGSHIVWADNRASRGNTYDNLIINGEAPCTDIYIYDIVTKEETLITNAREWEVWQSPVISGNHLVFTREHLVTAGAEPGSFTYIMDLH